VSNVQDTRKTQVINATMLRTKTRDILEQAKFQGEHFIVETFGKPMVAILHNLVGLLHANLAIYYAYIDRAPIFIIGATGPMDETKRRPRTDWIHTASVQGSAIRDYTKWDYQPNTIDGVPESFARAYGVMMTEPRGPVSSTRQTRQAP